VQPDDQETTESIARAEARRQAAPILTKFGVNQPFVVIAYNPITEIIADRKRIEFDSYHRSFGSSKVVPGEIADNRFVMELNMLDLPIGEKCIGFDAKTLGFSLTIKQTQTGKINVAQKDENVPASRGCPYDYDIEAIVETGSDSVEHRMVALVAYYAPGFEGPDRRFMAVPLALP
jgi:Predicted secreted protein (DUF2259)